MRTLSQTVSLPADATQQHLTDFAQCKIDRTCVGLINFVPFFDAGTNSFCEIRSLQNRPNMCDCDATVISLNTESIEHEFIDTL